MSRSIDYWRKTWDSVQKTSFPSQVKDDNAGKTLELLSQYAGFFKSVTIPCVGSFPIAWGGSIGRFFSFHWNTHHGNAVQNAIKSFYHRDSYWAHTPDSHSVEFILAQVKKEIGKRPINPNGDLARILKIVKEKTNVDYFTIAEEAIIDNFNAKKTLVSL